MVATKSLDGETVDGHTQLVFAWPERDGEGELVMSMPTMSDWYLDVPGKYPIGIQPYNIAAARCR